MEVIIINKLIVGIKREKYEILEEISKEGCFVELPNILMGLYLSLRFHKEKGFLILKSHLNLWQTNYNEQNTSTAHEIQLVEDILNICKKVEEIEKKELGEGNIHQIADESEIYKLIMLNALYYAIQLRANTLLSFLIQDKRMEINSVLIYILLKQELFTSVKELILINSDILDYVKINRILTHPKLKLLASKRTSTNLVKNGVSKDLERLNLGHIVDFMIKGKFSEQQVNLLIEECKDLQDSTVISTLLKFKKEAWAEKLILENNSYTDQVIIDAIKSQSFDFLIFFIQITRSELTEFENEIIGLIIDKISNDFRHIEYYLYMLFQYRKYVSVENSKLFLECILEAMDFNESAISIISGQPNPIKINVLIIEIILELVSMYPIIRRKGERIIEKLIYFIQQIQEHLENDERIREIYYDKDIQNRQVIYTIGKNQLISLLENKNIEVIINDIWNGPYSNDSNILCTTSTLSALLFRKGSSGQDIELLNRPNMFARDTKDMKSHKYQYFAWKEGIHSRYIFESFIFFLFFTINIIIILFFQKIVRSFYDDYFFPTYPAYIKKDYSEYSDAYISDYKQIMLKIVQIFYILVSMIMVYGCLIFHYIFTIAYLCLTNRQNIIGQVFQAEFIIDLFSVHGAIATEYYLGPIFWELYESVSADEDMSIQVRKTELFLTQRLLVIFCAILIITSGLRVFTILRVNSVFGPLLTMIWLMIKSMFTFLILYALNLLIFAIVGTILMFPSEKGTYSSLNNSLITLFQASLGTFDFADLDTGVKEFVDDYRVSKIYFTIFLLINLILLMNLLIAILSNIYTYYETKSSSLYNVQMIRLKHIFESDEYYSCLISAPNPFSCLTNTIPLIIFLFTSNIRHKKLHRKINNFVLHLEYSLLFLFLLPIYLVSNGILIPVVYIKYLCLKISLIFQDSNTKKGKTIKEVFIFFLFGIFILLLNYITDIFYFCVHSYSNFPKHVAATKKTDYISKEFYLKIQNFLENNIIYERVSYEELLSKMKELCGLKDFNFGIDNENENENERRNPGSYNYHRSNTQFLLEGMSKSRISTMRESEWDKRQHRPPDQLERREQIVNLAAVDTLMRNLCVLENGKRVVDLRLMYSLLYINLRMNQLRSRRGALGTSNTNFIGRGSVFPTYTSYNSRKSKIDKLGDVFQVLQEGGESKLLTEFLKDNILMNLLHSYVLKEIMESLIFLRSRHSQPLQIYALYKEIESIRQFQSRIEELVRIQGVCTTEHVDVIPDSHVQWVSPDTTPRHSLTQSSSISEQWPTHQNQDLLNTSNKSNISNKHQVYTTDTRSNQEYNLGRIENIKVEGKQEMEKEESTTQRVLLPHPKDTEINTQKEDSESIQNNSDSWN